MFNKSTLITKGNQIQFDPTKQYHFEDTLPKPQAKPEESKDVDGTSDEKPKEVYALIHFDDKSVLLQE